MANAGSMNKANAHQNTKFKKFYEAQKLKTAKNKEKHIKAHANFVAKKQAEKN